MADLQAKFRFFAAVGERADIITAAAFKVFSILLMNFHNLQSGRCDPSFATLVKSTGLARATVLKAVADLRDAGVIEMDSGGGGSSNRYRFPGLSDPSKIWTGPKSGPVAETDPSEIQTRPKHVDNRSRFRTEPVQISDPNSEMNKEENRDLCPKPAKPVRTRNRYPDDFEAFWTAYPTDSLMSKTEAGKAWSKLDGNDRASAIAAVTGFVSYCRDNPDYRAVHAVRFLSQRRFEGFGNSGQAQAQQSVEDRVLEHVFDFGGISAPHSTIRKIWSQGKWIQDWGPRPDQPDCRIPRELLDEIMGDKPHPGAEEKVVANHAR